MSKAREARRRMLAVSLGARSMVEALAAMDRIAAEADIAELRLDFFEEPFDLERLLKNRALPVVMTYRPEREGGRATLGEDERLAVLRRAANLGADYVDVEWDAASRDVVQSIKATGAEVIVSRHAFDRVPSDFERWYDQIAAQDADVVKIVGMAREARDVLPVLRVLERAALPTIAIAMGEAGLPSRVLALRHDACFLTYATLGTGERVAPGQLHLAEMRDVYEAGALGPETAVYAILGRNVETSLVARLNRRFRKAGRDAVVVPVPGAADPGAVVLAYRALPVAGWLVCDDADTTPLVTVGDQLSDRARDAGRVNLLVNRQGGLVGDWVEDPDSAFGAWTRDHSGSG